MNLQTAALEHLYYEDGVLFWKKQSGPRAVIGSKAGSICTSGHVSIELLGRTYKAHQLVYLIHFGHIPQEIDHINRIRSDNRIENLRPVTRSQNCANQTTQKRSASGFKGVTFLAKLNKWRARIKVAQKEIYLGLYAEKETAAAAYNQAATQYFGEFANVNNMEQNT